jgi:hypothetical protein
VTSASWLKVARFGVVLCVAVSSAIVLVQLPRALVRLDHRANLLESYTYDDREFAAGNSIIPNKQLLYEARALIPSNGTFHVVTGAKPISDASELTRTYAADFATYFLMPRRPSPVSPWVICLGCDVRSIGTNARTVWSDGAGSTLLRVNR